MNKPVFITGTGTDVGKTVVSAIITEALQADYWKPIQAGFDEGTDNLTIANLISNSRTIIYPETYKLKLPASPHIAAREEGVTISIAVIYNAYESILGKRANNKALPTINNQPSTNLSSVNRHLSSSLPTTNYQPPTIIEGAGGLMVPLNDTEFVIDLIKKLDARVVLVSRNYLGSINHSLLTAAVCQANNIDVAGWLFNDQYMHYEQEIAAWSGYPVIASIPAAATIDKAFVQQQAAAIKDQLKAFL